MRIPSGNSLGAGRVPEPTMPQHLDAALVCLVDSDDNRRPRLHSVDIVRVAVPD